MTVIVDTNVAVVANGESGQASGECEETCINRLEEITTGEVKLALDDQRRIIEEYRGNLSPHGQPGAGDAFLKWVEMNWTNSKWCSLVSITPVNGLENEFHEFPNDSALVAFDPDDRKFIAVAIAHPEKPPILQAVDSQWLSFRDALRRNRVMVEFLCEADIQRSHE